MVTVAPDTPVAELARMMVEKRISAVTVMDGEAIVGIVTEGDLLRRAEIGSEHGRRAGRNSLSPIGTSRPNTPKSTVGRPAM